MAQGNPLAGYLPIAEWRSPPSDTTAQAGSPQGRLGEQAVSPEIPRATRVSWDPSVAVSDEESDGAGMLAGDVTSMPAQPP